MTRRTAVSLLLAGSAKAARPATAFRAGVARVCISPREPVWMAGYAARRHPSTGVARDLFAKALAMEDSGGGRVVIVTMDLLRVPNMIVEPAAAEVRRRYGLQRSQLLVNCSHNHSGPTMCETASFHDAFTTLSEEDFEKTRRFTEGLKDVLVGLVGAALKDLAPAALQRGTGEAGFGANRRVKTAKGYDIGYCPDGPVDHRVPVLKVSGARGDVRAVLFGYTCHNTTLPATSYEISGDYAGFAQSELERSHPGATALFLQLCAGDQDPHPRGTAELAERHGKELAATVDGVLRGNLQDIHGPIRTSYRTVDLAFAPHTRESFEAKLNDANAAVVRNARAMLRDYDQGHPIRTLAYPVQAVSVGREMPLVAIGGEPVVDYALRAQREFPKAVLAGYSNLVKGYIPSRRVLAEGGYEGGDSMIYYGLPGPFTPAVEDTIFDAIRDVLRRMGQ